MKTSKQGHVYILESENCDCIKIGGTDFPPTKRLKEINETEPYKSLGPWVIVDFREVLDWRMVEHNLHYRFRDFQNKKILNQKELFHVSKNIAI
ncbi:MAG: GIY-YIG nuclease family protein [Spirochaetaceae bacterium]|nr:GIY-YIG nuclease family protein [Spirochaetaceae bacterium]